MSAEQQRAAAGRPAMKVPAPTVFALFQIGNNYDQPDHGLVMLWAERPTLTELAAAMGSSFPANRDEETLAIVKLWSGEHVYINNERGNNLWWTATVTLGQPLPDRETNYGRKRK